MVNALEGDCRELWILVFDEGELSCDGVLEVQMVVDEGASEKKCYIEQCVDKHCAELS